MSMEEVLHKRKQERKRRLDEAREYAARVAQQQDVTAAVVIGSVTRGDFQPGSDTDVVILSAELPATPLERAEALYECAAGTVEPKGLTPAELAREYARRNPLAVETVEAGIVVYGALPAVTTGSPDEGDHDG